MTKKVQSALADVGVFREVILIFTFILIVISSTGVWMINKQKTQFEEQARQLQDSLRLACINTHILQPETPLPDVCKVFLREELVRQGLTPPETP